MAYPLLFVFDTFGVRVGKEFEPQMGTNHIPSHSQNRNQNAECVQHHSPMRSAGSIAVSVIPRGGISINAQINIEGFREYSVTDVS
jgi:hypothetical protein